MNRMENVPQSFLESAMIPYAERALASVWVLRCPILHLSSQECWGSVKRREFSLAGDYASVRALMPI